MAETGVRHDLSFAAFVDGHPASFCLGALRGGRGEHPRRGHRSRLPSARAGRAGARRAPSRRRRPPARATSRWRCSTGNDPALALYERHGFAGGGCCWDTSSTAPRWGCGPHARRSRPAAGRGGGPICSTAGAGRSAVAAPPASLEHLPALPLAGEAVVFGRRRGSRFWLYALAVDPAPARPRRWHPRAGGAGRARRSRSRRWCPRSGTRRTGSWTAAGGVLDPHRQWEMTRTLARLTPRRHTG